MHRITAAVTTGSVLAAYGDMSTFAIVDHAAGASLEYVPTVVGVNGLPTHQRGWRWHARTGSKVLDTGAWRVLKL